MLQVNAHREDNPLKMGKRLEQVHPKQKDIQMAKKYFLNVFSIISQQRNGNKSAMNYHATFTKVAQIQTTDNKKCW